MLYFNTTTNQRYNERTLALANLSPEDNDVHELHVERPTFDPRFEAYRDTQQVVFENGRLCVAFEVYNLPRDRILSACRSTYRQAVSTIRHGDLTVDAHVVQDPVGALSTLKAWRSALDQGLAFEPSIQPFVESIDAPTSTVLADIITAVEDHLSVCDVVEGEIDPYLNTESVETLKTVSARDWAQARYTTLTA